MNKLLTIVMILMGSSTLAADKLSDPISFTLELDGRDVTVTCHDTCSAKAGLMSIKNVEYEMDDNILTARFTKFGRYLDLELNTDTIDYDYDHGKLSDLEEGK